MLTLSVWTVTANFVSSFLFTCGSIVPVSVGCCVWFRRVPTNPVEAEVSPYSSPQVALQRQQNSEGTRLMLCVRNFSILKAVLCVVDSTYHYLRLISFASATVFFCNSFSVAVIAISRFGFLRQFLSTSVLV